MVITIATRRRLALLLVKNVEVRVTITGILVFPEGKTERRTPNESDIFPLCE
jgi:hypothetical protein